MQTLVHFFSSVLGLHSGGKQGGAPEDGPGGAGAGVLFPGMVNTKSRM